MKKNSIYYLSASVSLISFLVYLPSLRNDFVWDDMAYIVENPYIQSFDLAMVKWAFSHFYVANWHPLSWMSHALDYALWGLNPLGHHLTNVFLHAGNTFLVVFLTVKLMDPLKETTRQDTSRPTLHRGVMLIMGGVAGLLFGLHPLHVESVAWVTERKDLLCALFFLLSINAYLDYVKITEITLQNSFMPSFNKQYLFSLILFMFALLSKPMAVSLPPVLLVFDWYPLSRISSFKDFRAAVLEKLPFIGVALISSILTVLAQTAGEAIVSVQIITFTTRLINAAKSLVGYLWKMMFPVQLLPFYPYQKKVSLLSLDCLLSVVLVLGITLTCIVIARKQKVWLAAWAYYVITLLPVLGIVQVGGQSMADRYTYLPSLGPFLLTGLTAAWLYTKATAKKNQTLAYKFFGLVTAIALLVSMAYLTSKQVAIWRNSFVLWSYVIQQDPVGLPYAYRNRGIAFNGQGDFNQAIEDFNKAIALHPSYYEVYGDRGLAFVSMGQLSRALEDFDKALAIQPSYYQAYYNRGTLFVKMGQFSRAIEDFDKAIAIQPPYHQAYYNRGLAFVSMGQLSRAIEDFDKAIAIQPSYYQAYYNRGTLFGRMGQFTRAIEDFDKTIAIQPSYYQAYYNRGTLSARMGQFTRAIEDFDKTISLQHDFYQAYYNRGLALSHMGQFSRAIKDFDRTIALNPSYTPARSSRDIAIDRLNRSGSPERHPE